MVLTDTREKIKNMEIRGAGRIARAAVEALADHAESIESQDIDHFRNDMESAAEMLVRTRPTAVSLPNAVHIVMEALSGEDSVTGAKEAIRLKACLLYTSPSPRDYAASRMPSSA